MKYILSIIIIIALSAPSAFGQFAIRAFHKRTGGDFGSMFKPMTSAEFMLSPRFSRRSNNRTRFSFAFLLLNYKPRMEVFETIGELPDGTRGVTGTISYSKYRVSQLACGLDYAFIHKEKFNVFAGFDIVGGGASVDYEQEIFNRSNTIYSGGGFLVGLRGRIGMEYSITKAFSVFASFQMQGNTVEDPANSWRSNDLGIGVRYSR
jgi:hypothetical protein